MDRLFSHVTRVWCAADCGHRTLLIRTHDGVCNACIQKAIAQMEHDDEMRSLRGYTDEERARI